jgi:putative ABC transport system permease protein
MILRVLFQTLFLAIGQIWANKFRAILTTLGIVIGVAAVVSTVAAVNGLRQYVLNEFATIGAKKVFFDGSVPRKLRGTQAWASVQLKLREIKAIQENARSIEAICPIFMSVYDIQNGETIVKTVSVTGIWPAWHQIEARSVTKGREFDTRDEDQRLNVCLINDKAIDELGLDKDPTDDFLLIGGRRFKIAGVVETKTPAFGGDTQTEVYVPFSTAMAMRPEGFIAYCLANLRSTDLADEAQAEIKAILRKLRQLEPDQEDTFVVGVFQSFIDQFNKIAAAITFGTAGIVAISMVVGGIGIMNIMLVSVSERTREIGLRKAVGARPEVILLQFLVEAVTLCLAGGAIGLVVGQGAVLAIRALGGTSMSNATIPPWAVVLAVGFSAATGVIFGMFPAIKAARLNPIDALRHE